MKNTMLMLSIKKLRDITGASLLVCKEALLKNNNDINRSIKYINSINKNKKLYISSIYINKGLILSKIINLNNYKKLGCIIEVGCETDFVSKNSEYYSSATKILNFILKTKIFDKKKLNQKLKNFLILLTNRFKEVIKIRKIYYLIGDNIVIYNHMNKIGVILSITKDINDTNVDIDRKLAMHIVAKKPLFFSKKDINNSLIDKQKKKEIMFAKKKAKNQKVLEIILNNRLNQWFTEVCFLEQRFIFNEDITIENLLKQHNIYINAYIYIKLGQCLKNDILFNN